MSVLGLYFKNLCTNFLTRWSGGPAQSLWDNLRNYLNPISGWPVKRTLDLRAEQEKRRQLTRSNAARLLHVAQVERELVWHGHCEITAVAL